jgi:hypothetical protein
MRAWSTTSTSRKIPAAPSRAPSWKEAEHLKRLRRLMDPATSLERAWDEISRKNGGAPQATVEALMFSLRSRSTKALLEPAVQRRLSKLSDRQVIEVGNRLQRLKPEIARAWSSAEVEILFEARIANAR